MKAIRALVMATLMLITVGACGTPSSVASPQPGSPGATAVPLSTESPQAASDLPAVQCAEQAGNGWPGAGSASAITDVRTGQQAGYDRFVIQLAGAVPGYRVRRQASNQVTLDPSGLPATLSGAAALIVSLNPASAHDSYRGSTDLHTGYATLREARQLGDFEAVNSWGLGLDHAACFRTFTLTSPPRLVIDLESSN